MTRILALLFILVASPALAQGEVWYTKFLNLKPVNSSVIQGADFQKPVTVVQFFASWCQGCSEAMVAISNRMQGIESAQFLIVSIDEEVAPAKIYLEKKLPASHQALIKSAFVDLDQKLVKSYAVPSVPFVIILDAQGKVLLAHEGLPSATVLDQIANFAKGKQ